MAKHRLFKNFETVTIISLQGSIQATFVPKRGGEACLIQMTINQESRELLYYPIFLEA